MDENQKQKFKIKLISLNEKLRKKRDLEVEHFPKTEFMYRGIARS